MPAPTQASLQNFMKQALLAQGFAKGSYDSQGNFVQSPTDLPDDMDRMVRALAVALAAQWAQWQVSTVVEIPVTSAPGSPSVGILQ